MIKLEFSWRSAAVLVSLYVAYHLLKAVYRVTFHPLARFPGPILAALTYKYEFYFDGIKGGQYTNKIAGMHEQYGPLDNSVRAGESAAKFVLASYRTNCPYQSGRAPLQRSCFHRSNIYEWGQKATQVPLFPQGIWSDVRLISQFLEERLLILSADRHWYDFNPRPTIGDCLDSSNAHEKGGFATADHDHHRVRRAAVNRFFSKASITKLEPIIHDLAQRLCNKILAQPAKPFDITNAYSCFTTDVVTSYCFGQKQGLLDQEDFEPNLRKAIQSGCRMLPVVRQWPTMFGLVQSLPECAVRF